MQLIRHADEQFAILAIDSRGVQIADLWWQAPFVLNRSGPKPLENPFAEVLQLNAAAVEQFLHRWPADVVLLSTGAKAIFPSTEVRAAFLSRGVGLEIMDLRSAAYTYNVLLQELRSVVLWAIN